MASRFTVLAPVEGGVTSDLIVVLLVADGRRLEIRTSVIKLIAARFSARKAERMAAFTASATGKQALALGQHQRAHLLADLPAVQVALFVVDAAEPA